VGLDDDSSRTRVIWNAECFEIAARGESSNRLSTPMPRFDTANASKAFALMNRDAQADKFGC